MDVNVFIGLIRCKLIFYPMGFEQAKRLAVLALAYS